MEEGRKQSAERRENCTNKIPKREPARENSEEKREKRDDRRQKRTERRDKG